MTTEFLLTHKIEIGLLKDVFNHMQNHMTEWNDEILSVKNPENNEIRCKLDLHTLI